MGAAIALARVPVLSGVVPPRSKVVEKTQVDRHDFDFFLRSRNWIAHCLRRFRLLPESSNLPPAPTVAAEACKDLGTAISGAEGIPWDSGTSDNTGLSGLCHARGLRMTYFSEP